MTEEEARKKWCPFVRLRSDGAYNYEPYNRANCGVPDGTKCIASDCMMWQETILCTEGPPGEKGRVTVTGHCGLAGEP